MAEVRISTSLDPDEAEFASVDALIAEAEGRAEHHGPVDEVGDDSLNVDERHEVDEAMSLVYGTAESQVQSRGEV
ncbi:hypothetical protein [Nocardiopsis sp. JB363]|uniref:hypothetical protein n=1 Tax=Nocardiopsis sp. JB363 TaxID=1434837 RepID=UPI00097A8F5F|nr:hypothetical protein [Nocardiopsis sp. JB363]SIO86033.1 hypothetical protein BQ8420_09950 [Nocardiopsis sp. JB363]